MLSPSTPFPNVGSYALLIDSDADPKTGVELVRILERRVSVALVAFPLRDGASGNKVVPVADLIDASPLTDSETREFHDLDRALFGRTRFRTPKQKQDKARRDELHSRVLYGPILDRQLRFVRAREDQQRRAA